MLDRWRRHWRRRLLRRLRPGREIKELLSIISRAEAVQSEEHRSMLERLVEFSDLRVRELMVPRTDIQAVELGSSLAKVVECLMTSGRSRLPVYAGDLDHIQGLVYAWEVFAAQIKGKSAPLSDFLRPCLTVPETQLVMGLLSRMRQSGCHVAIALDEYGGTAGLVTLTDLLREIVGPLVEEGDEGDGSECEPQPDGSFIVLARMHIEDLEDVLGRPLPSGEFDTVGGLITHELGRIPVRGEQLTVAGMDVRILAAEPRRVLKVRIEAPFDASSD